jgi:hypothetical protein
VGNRRGRRNFSIFHFLFLVNSRKQLKGMAGIKYTGYRDIVLEAEKRRTEGVGI